MDGIEKIKDEVRALSSGELAAFREWFNEFDSEAWDRGIEADARAGKLDSLASRAMADHRSGEATRL